MKALTTTFIASFVFANAAMAADSQVGSSAAGATVAASAAVATSASAVQKIDTSKVSKAPTRSRSEVRAEAVEALKTQKTALAEQLSFYQ